MGGDPISREKALRNVTLEWPLMIRTMPLVERPQHMAEQQTADDQIATMASTRDRVSMRAFMADSDGDDLLNYNMSL